MFTIANILTALNLLCGVGAIIFSLSGRLDWAVYLIGCAAVFDFLDGFVARLTKSNSLMGKQLDSLADLVSFGVAPGILMFVMILIKMVWQIAKTIVQIIQIEIRETLTVMVWEMSVTMKRAG